MRFLLLWMLLLSCNEPEEYISAEELLSMGKAQSPDFIYVVPPGIGVKLVDCEQYKPRCEVGYKVRVKLLEFNALMYKNHSDAMTSAKTFSGYQRANWAFDYVVGEPIIERFVENVFKAKRQE